MASGDFSYCDPRELFICVPWVGPSCYALAYNGYEFYNENGQGGFYCASGSYCPSGFIFFNQNDLGYSAFNNSTGCYCCAAYSDGTGFYYWKTIYYSGTILECSEICLNIENELFNNGYRCSISDGTGSLFYICNFCQNGYNFIDSDRSIYASDGTGFYFKVEKFSQLTNKVEINWDFSARVKEKYKFINIDGIGSNILISLNQDCFKFYEINSICESSVCLLEANQQKAMHLQDAVSPFVYIRNVGCKNLLICISDNQNCSSFKECQIFNKICYIDSNINLYPKEFVVFSLRVSSDGCRYYSVSEYPFGFFYEFKNYNPFGLYPLCCVFEPITNSCIPTLAYSKICNLPLSSGCINSTGYAYCYQKQLSFYENLTVDQGSSLEISFFKKTGTLESENFYINKNFQINSSYGFNCFESCVRTNKISILDQFCETFITDACCVFCTYIDQNLNINVVYDVDFEFKKKYNLIYCNYNSGESCHQLNLIKKTQNSDEFFYNSQDILNLNNVINLQDGDTAFIEIIPEQNSSIKSLANKNINRNNLYLPTIEEFGYNYCFELNRTDFCFDKSQSGFWNSGTNLCLESGFCNYSVIIDCSCQEYQQYKSCIYNINLCQPKVLISTASIQDKCCFSKSDDFYITDSSIECSFYFCNLEFKYKPVQCVIRAGIAYCIPNEDINIQFEVFGNIETVNFPKQAINYDKLKLNVDYSVFDLLENSELNLMYSDFCFQKKYTRCSNLNYSIPIVGCCSLNCHEYPNIIINNSIKQIKREDAFFKINPINCFVSDSFYGLNNFLLFLTSKMNSGLALDFLNCEEIQFCDYYFNSNEYNFLMMDLKSEFDSSCFSIPNVCWINLTQKINYIEDFNNIISYKNNTGDGYNYITPIVTSYTYSDTYFESGIAKCNSISESGFLNCIYTGYNYDGSSLDLILFCDQNQNVTGCALYSPNRAFFNVDGNNYSINLQPNDLTGCCAFRKINYCRNYKFTGIQPFYIYSNYEMLDIRNPIICENFKFYSSFISEQSKSGLYYYIYDIANPQNTNVRFISPDLTCIYSINLFNCSIFFNSTDSKIGLIRNNSATVNLNIDKLIYENPYCFSEGLIQTICINIIGSL